MSVHIECRKSYINQGGKRSIFWRCLECTAPQWTRLFNILLVGLHDLSGNSSTAILQVTVQCPIDFKGERLWNTKSVNGTFDNLVHTVAMVRIPDGTHSCASSYLSEIQSPSPTPEVMCKNIRHGSVPDRPSNFLSAPVGSHLFLSGPIVRWRLYQCLYGSQQGPLPAPVGPISPVGPMRPYRLQ
jgi:hypothetical protein